MPLEDKLLWDVPPRQRSELADALQEDPAGVLEENEALFVRTDTMRNILSNKLTAIGRLEAKDVVDILYIARNLSFNRMGIFEEAEKKDMWVNPVDTAALLEQFPIEKTDTIAWSGEKPNEDEFKKWLHSVTADILTGDNNSLYTEKFKKQ